jgi:hypothetical protein
MIEKAKHTAGPYVPLPWAEGGWTVGCPDEHGEMQPFPITFYVSVSVQGDEGRAALTKESCNG